jgi:hypothetical protein
LHACDRCCLAPHLNRRLNVKELPLGGARAAELSGVY